MERTSATSHVGNIYKGRVTNVEPSIQAAFVDFGLGRNGFLHISDLMPSYFGRRGEDVQESVGRKLARRDRPPIQRCLRRGDDIIVQIIKEGIGTKGPTLTTYLSIPGRILVMMPGMSKLGVSRKIEDDEERRRLRQILDSLKPLKDCGFIIRTAGVGKTKTGDPEGPELPHAIVAEHGQEDRVGAGADRALHRGRPGDANGARRVHRRHREDHRRQQGGGAARQGLHQDRPATHRQQGGTLRERAAAVSQIRHRARDRADVQPARAAAQRRVAGDRFDRSGRRHRRQQRQVPRPHRRGDDRVQDRHGGRQRDPAAAPAARPGRRDHLRFHRPSLRAASPRPGKAAAREPAQRPRQDQDAAHEPVRDHRDDPPAHAAFAQAVHLLRLPALQGRRARQDAREHGAGRHAAASHRRQ